MTKAVLMTLLELSGVTLRTDLDRATLVLIDYQNEYLETGGLPLKNVGAAVEKTRALLDLARARRMPVIHVVHRGAVGGLFDRGASRGAIIGRLAPLPGEVVIEKGLPNSFAGTELETALRAQPGRDQLLVAGLMSHMCLTATVSSAVDHGFISTVVAETTTTRDLVGAEGQPVPAEQVTAAALAILKDRFARVVPTIQDL